MSILRPLQPLNREKQQLARRLTSRVKDFPSLPAFVNRIMQLNADPDSTLADIARVVEAEVSLATAVIKMANSPLFGAVQPVSSIAHALTMLGRQEVVNLVLAQGMLQTIKGFKKKKKIIGQLRLHCYHCAVCSRWLAVKAGLPAGDFFMAGLVHDLGKIIIYLSLSDEMLTRLYYNDPIWHGDITAEEMRLGVGHTFLGRALLESWMFPEPLKAAVEFHHQPQLSKEYTTYPLFIGTADILVRLLTTDLLLEKARDLQEKIGNGLLNLLLREKRIVIDPASIGNLLAELKQEFDDNRDLMKMFV